MTLARGPGGVREGVRFRRDPARGPEAPGPDLLLVSWAAFRSRRLDAFLGGTPTLVLADGRPQPRGLREERMHEQELAFEVRQEGIEDGRWTEIRTMHIEANGAPAVVKADWARPVRRSDT